MSAVRVPLAPLALGKCPAMRCHRYPGRSVCDIVFRWVVIFVGVFTCIRLYRYGGTPLKGHPRYKDTSVLGTLCYVPNKLS